MRSGHHFKHFSIYLYVFSGGDRIRKRKDKEKAMKRRICMDIYISNTNEDKTHFQDHLHFDQLVGLPQGEYIYIYI